MQTDERKLPSSDDDVETDVDVRKVAEERATEQEQEASASDEYQASKDRPAVDQPVYIMIPKIYSEGVSLRDDGPLSTVEYSSKCLYKTPQTYVTQADIVPRLIPKYYITMVRVNEELENIITYHERVEFVHTLRVKEFSETVNSFPKEVSNDFITTLTYDPNYTHRHYVTSLVMEPAQVLELPVGGCDEDELSTGCVTKNEIAATCNGEEMLAHGSACEKEPVALLNGTA